MKRYILIATILISAINFSHAQIYEIGKVMDLYSTNQIHNGEWKNILSEDDIKGSPYLNDEFITSTIFTTSKYQFIDILLRYNIYNDELEFKTPTNEVQALATPEIIEFVEFDGYKMVYIPFTTTKKIRRGFFIVEEEGEASLFKRLEIIFKKAEEPGAYKEAEPPKFVKKSDSYYIRINTEMAKKVGSKNELLEIFPDHKDEISTFVKKNKVKTSKPEKLKELVRYYNSL
ncbi:MAG: hypothetical protein GQ525_14835 [Draconibacterium sp.]|nr:hypothetical protein [Draconibacterium sp.]